LAGSLIFFVYRGKLPQEFVEIIHFSSTTDHTHSALAERTS